MTKEIGSEFWEVDISDKREMISENNYIFLLSGRTSIDFIVNDIRVTRKLNSVYMPSYCCHTMIEPFVTKGINVKFYNVDFVRGKFLYDVDYSTKCDIVLVMQYFGFTNTTVEKIISEFKQMDKIIIEDATHSWFSNSPYNKKSDYVFASFRKWTGITCGAIVIKRYSGFFYSIHNRQNNNYLEIRQKASYLKKMYINKKLDKKDDFLHLFNSAENLLEKDYKEYIINNEIYNQIISLDYKKIRDKRRKNAKYLINELIKYKDLETLPLSEEDTPLFVPIIISNGERDDLRQHLIRNNVYCPVHWPKSNLHDIVDFKVYDRILSLICDQRYDIDDMARIIELLDEFYGG